MRQLNATYVDHFVAATGDASDVTANAGKTVHASLADEDVITTADIIVAAPEAAHYSTQPASRRAGSVRALGRPDPDRQYAHNPPCSLIDEQRVDMVSVRLGLSNSVVADLVGAGILRPMPDSEYAAIRQHRDKTSVPTI
jgi:hypothetical protein